MTEEAPGLLTVTFDEYLVEIHVGLSPESADAADSALQAGPNDFDTARADAAHAWETSLSGLHISGATDTQLTLLYTSAYRAQQMPTELTGAHVPFSGTASHFSDLYCMWDLIRCTASWMLLTDPARARRLVESILQVAEWTGWLPDAWIGGSHGKLQGGTPAIVFLAEALEKLPGLDANRIHIAVQHDLEQRSPDPVNVGRYPVYQELGYLPAGSVDACVSRTLEYAYEDWLAAQIAARSGRPDEARRLLDRAQQVWALWNEDLRGFAPRTKHGEWVPDYQPTSIAAKPWLDPFFYEVSGDRWSWNVQHDVPELITRHGGAEAFERALDDFFDRGRYRSKETMMHVPFLYNWVGKPEKSASRAAEIIRDEYRLGRDGLSDNEDMGAQSCWYLWANLGIYPVMGQSQYFLFTPSVENAKIRLGAAPDAPYLEVRCIDPVSGPRVRDRLSVRFNGEVVPSPFIEHHRIAMGGVLTFEYS